MTALARVSLNQIDDPFSLPRGHGNVRSWDPPRLHRDRWDLVHNDLAELIFLTGLVSWLIIKGVMAINIVWGGYFKGIVYLDRTRSGKEKWQPRCNETESDWQIVGVKCEMCFSVASGAVVGTSNMPNKRPNRFIPKMQLNEINIFRWFPLFYY